MAERRYVEIESIPIRIVPLQALGQPEPAAPPPRAEPAPKPAPPAETEEERPRPAPTRERPAESRPESPPQELLEPRQREGSAFGSATGTATFGAALGGLDHPDFVYNYYVEQMLSMISAHWARPPVERGIEAVVRFRIDRRGQVSDLELLRSSGQPSFDLAGLRAVRLAAPLPPLPASFPAESLGVNLIIR